MEDILDYIDKNLRDIETGNVKQFVEKANADETGSVEVKVSEENHLPEKEFAIISTDKNGFMQKSGYIRHPTKGQDFRFQN